MIIDILKEFWLMTAEMGYSLLIGFLIAGIFSIFISPEFIQRHLGKKGVASVIKAALMGVPLPVCSCGVIPVSASLRKNGASKSATVSFLISTPQTGVDSIVVTYSLMGVVLGIFRPIAALLTGIFGGFLEALFDSGEEVDNENIEIEHNCSGGTCKIADNKQKKGIKEALKYGFIELPQDISSALLIGLLVSGIISILVPDDFFASFLGDNVLLQYVVMLVIGIPIYVCSTGSIPVAVALIMKGISPGAALIFLMSGPATNAATISTIWKIMGKKTLIIYLTTIGISSLVAGYIFDAFFGVIDISASHDHIMDLPLYKHISAGLLIFILFFSIYKKYQKSSQITEKEKEAQMELIVKDMTCNHCVKAIKGMLEQKFDVKADIDLSTGKVLIEKELNRDEVIKEIEELGYTVDHS
ncbi:MAG: hypothetical protein C0601_03415 [Candidatus Muiribacterium halophilum]|uniref:HMA domain-containing protein n=1 Tax=Muiribacterium halophilum TaxID=2053465 RepID=A0A2N5ZJX2_MUIH1|nr:MAG: hypothetical protein C0601_03415 [Candidatus Muirbacterium halophilum]